MNERIDSTIIRELEAFRAVLDLEKTTAAASLLGVSQPTISKLLASLQARTNETLFRKEGGRLTPTPHAIKLKAKLEDLFSELTGVRDLYKSDALSEHLNVGCTSTLAEAVFAPAIAEFVSAHPHIRVTLHVANYETIVRELVTGNIDLGVSPRDLDGEGLACDILQQSYGAVLMPVGHRLTKKALIEPRDMINEPMVTIPSFLPKHAMLDAIFAEHGVTPEVVASSNSIAVCAELIRQGLGIGVHNPFPIALRPDSGIAIRRFSPNVVFRTSVIRRIRGGQPQAAGSFVEFLTKYVGSLDFPRELFEVRPEVQN